MSNQNYQEYPPLLPKGLHHKLLSEITDICITPFTEQGRRQYLFDRLVELLKQLRRFGINLEIWIDGSYLTEKPNPQDIDMVVFLPRSNHIPRFARDLIDELTRTHNEIKARYACDLFFAPYEDPTARIKWGTLFGKSKGIIVIAVPEMAKTA